MLQDARCLQRVYDLHHIELRCREHVPHRPAKRRKNVTRTGRRHLLAHVSEALTWVSANRRRRTLPYLVFHSMKTLWRSCRDGSSLLPSSSDSERGPASMPCEHERVHRREDGAVSIRRMLMHSRS